MFAHQRIAVVFDEGIRKRISAPIMGVNRTIERMWSMGSIPSYYYRVIQIGDDHAIWSSTWITRT